ncbi:hypothetical protein M3P05_00515 [Sansalvadorimonas sp. 2012CJ34-2]|uniref:Uncharacterized protein n=1 Tax=Parendozoicomonas callyspongiae TaxID=2942213 RepID=A0ABT0PCF0_9GAMM|nr:hypothetical protein [Sansalvadorimonas sp. 2012CJ34-2]MCL6268432.1 hypothetical protein [Sansalvadorimonas sp. 2012CJ34-2]
MNTCWFNSGSRYLSAILFLWAITGLTIGDEGQGIIGTLYSYFGYAEKSQTAVEDSNGNTNIRLRYGVICGSRMCAKEDVYDQQLISRISVYFNELNKNECRNFRPAAQYGKYFQKKKTKVFPHENYIVCYTPDDDNDLELSVSLMGMERYQSYLQMFRLPLEHQGYDTSQQNVHPLEISTVEGGCNDNLAFTDFLSKAEDKRDFIDAVSIFPLLVKLGRALRMLSASLYSEWDLVSTTDANKGKIIYVTDSQSQRETIKTMGDNNPLHFFVHPADKQLPKQFYEVIYIPTSVVVPDEMRVLYPSDTKTVIEQGKPLSDFVAKNEQWTTAFELLTFIIHKMLEPVVSETAPYFLGFVPESRALGVAQKSGFYDLALLGGHVTHGTVVHMLQILRFKEMGMEKEHLNSINQICWSRLLDDISMDSWFLGSGVCVGTRGEYSLAQKDKCYMFHNFPRMNVPPSLHRMLTTKLLSRLIYSIEETASLEEQSFFRSSWLKTSDNLKQVAQDIEVLENTILTEHLMSWRRILKHEKKLTLSGADHGSERYFDPSLIHQEVITETIGFFRDRGYTVEKVNKRSYIIYPPPFPEFWQSAWNHLSVE